jgi:hypothetical protein
MSKVYTIKIKCESADLKSVMMDVLLLSKGQLSHHLAQALLAKGIESDIKIKIQGDELAITQKSGDKGIVLVSSGIGYEAVGYDTLSIPSKYMVVKDGSVTVYVKMPDNVDRAIARYQDLEEAVANINSNDVEDAFRNVTKETNTPALDVNTTNEVADISETV